ncbi:hypothetical protein [Exiguobacterium alkaliphilum]|uniref:hypothetical protein n=1 Tax=Exiguobacterium alkaliphilum TaxID=1428684 RepID=UPI0034649E2A
MGTLKEKSAVSLTADQIIPTTTVTRSFKKVREKAQAVPLFVTNAQGEIDTVLVGFNQFEEMTELIQRQAALLEELELLSRLNDATQHPDEFVDADDVFKELGIE